MFQIFHSARLELHNAWKDSYGAVNELLRKLDVFNWVKFENLATATLLFLFSN